MDIQPPIYISGRSIGPGSSVFGGAPGASGCSPITAGIIGAVLMYALPPFLSGLLGGARDAWRERND